MTRAMAINPKNRHKRKRRARERDGEIGGDGRTETEKMNVKLH
jgi:hypothetical protein